ncbi:hypothetical protein NXY55_26965, partial [Aeromonas veronii]|nr:hypothetical protein [Aeromonas veronii]
QKRENNDIVNSLYEDLKTRLNFNEVSKKVNPDFGMQMFPDAIYLDAEFTYNYRNYKIIFVKKTFKDENIIIETTLISDNDSTTLNDDIYTIKTTLKSKAVNDEDFEDIWSDIKSEIEDYCNDMTNKISSSTVEEEFYLETPLVEISTSTSLVKIVSQGFISPERGSSDSLSIFLVDNGV